MQPPAELFAFAMTESPQGQDVLSECSAKQRDCPPQLDSNSHMTTGHVNFFLGALLVCT